jgi:hypothetical protein
LLPVGDKVEIDVFLDSGDPIASPTISVEATQGGTTLTLDALAPGHPLYKGKYVYYKFVDFDPGLLGSWEIVPTDSTGIGTSVSTNPIPDPEFLPLVEDITVQGTTLGARVSWTLPNLVGFDVDGTFVRIIEAISGTHMWISDALPVQTTSFVAPASEFQPGVDYVYHVSLFDGEDFSYYENWSSSFSEPFRFTTYTTNGDFNLDGSVDAADYVVWRNGLGTIYTQNDYKIWRAHFGQIAGSGSTLPSAEPLSAAVPEPSMAVLFTCSMAPLFVARLRRRGRISLMLISEPARTGQCGLRDAKA